MSSSVISSMFDLNLTDCDVGDAVDEDSGDSVCADGGESSETTKVGHSSWRVGASTEASASVMLRHYVNAHIASDSFSVETCGVNICQVNASLFFHCAQMTFAFARHFCFEVWNTAVIEEVNQG